MNDGKRSYFSSNKNNLNNKSNNNTNEVEIEIEEINLSGDGAVSGEIKVSDSDNKDLDSNSVQNSDENLSDTSSTSVTGDSGDSPEVSENISGEESSNDSLDDMEDVSDDAGNNSGEENKVDESEKREDNKNEQSDKQKLDENDEKKGNNGSEQQEQDNKNLNDEDNQEKTEKDSTSNENNNSGSEETKTNDNSGKEQKEQSSNSGDNNKKDSKKDNSEQKSESSENSNKSHDSSKKDSSGKEEQKGGLPKNNRNGRSPQDIKNNLKDNLKNNLNPKNIGKNAFNRTKLGQNINKAKNTINNAKKAAKAAKKTGKAAVKAAKTIGKAATSAAKGLLNLIISTMPWSLIIIGVVLLIFMIIILIGTLFPGVGGSVNDSENLSNYSKADQKTIEKIQTLFKKYPNADGTLAMSVVLYPYFETLHNGDVTSYFYEETDEEPEEIEDSTIDDEDIEQDDEDIEDEESDYEENDIYLQPLRKSKIRKRLKKILKKLNSSSDDEFKEYLKDKYFKQDKGYSAYDGDAFNGFKEMFDTIKRNERDEFADIVIENIYNNKELFINYVFEAQICSSSSTSLGYSDGTDLIKGQAVVVLKDTKETTISSIKSAPTLFGTDDYHMDLKRYVLGVIYAETGEWIFNEEFAKVKMIAAKSYVLGITHVGGPNSVGRMRTPDYEDNKTIFYLKNNEGDQVFCDVYEGCQNGSRYALSLITPGNGPGTDKERYEPKASVSKDKITLLEKWYDEIAGEFIYNTDLEQYYSSYRASSNDMYCPVGACLLQNPAHQDALNGSGYEAILKKYFSDDKYVIKNIETNTLSAVAVNCTNVLRGGCTIPDDKFVYYSQRSYNDNFCGRTDGTISSSGCGVTSMAMIIANLTDNKLTPVDTMNEAHQGGHCGAGIYGTNSSYFSDAASKHGLNYETLAASDTSLDADKKIKDTLNSGGLIIANVAGATTAGGGNAWSTVNVGHYLVIKGITADEKLIIADPMTTALNNPWKNNLTIEEMRSYMHNKLFYLFTGGNAEKNKEKYCGAKGAGYLGNPFDPNDITRDFMSEGNASCFPNYCGSGSPHGAIDIAVGEGTPIYAMDSGIVEVSRWNISWGNYVLINHGNGYKTLYAHFSELGVSEGQQVVKGQQIGKSGNTGNSSGPHLHIELQNIALYDENGRIAAKSSDSKGLMNPAKYINSNISYVGQTN